MMHEPLYNETDQVAEDPRAATAAQQARFLRFWPVFESRFRQLYPGHADLETLLSALAVRLRDAADARPVALQAQDAAREAAPDWRAESGHTTYTFYVDRLAGDLQGLRGRLDYLQELGVRWLHPLPLLKPREGDSDGGFAVADYRAVDPRLGDMSDLAALAADLRARGMGLLLDVVCNHTAQEHDWAVRARAGDPTYRDYYITVETAEVVQVWERDLVDVFPDTAPGSFTYDAGMGGHVWTTFYPFQWDLNYANPTVFVEMLEVLVYLAGQGVDGFRLDSAPFLWKRAGSNCRNQPEAYAIVEAWRAALSIVAPGVVLLAEAIERLDDVLPFFGGEAPGCDLAYNNGVMTALWAALADQDAGVARTLLAAAAARPQHGAWLNYVRCHDDLIWNALAGHTGSGDLQRWSEFYAGAGFSGGRAFQTAPGGAPSTNGMTASLVGLGSPGVDPEAAFARLALLYGVIHGLDGWPLIYMGDEIALGNDENFDADPDQRCDGRWLHRPKMDWSAAEQRMVPGATSHRAFERLRQLGKAARSLNPLGVAGRARPLDLECGPVLAFERRGGRTGLLVVANLSPSPVEFALPAPFATGHDLLGDQDARPHFKLAPYGLAWIASPA